MNLLTLLIFAVGLCFDSFAVSLSCGMSGVGYSRWRLFRFAGILALFQGVMPILGWTLVFRFRDSIDVYDHWVAFGLLLLLGGRMIWESFETESEKAIKEKGNPFDWGRNLLLGLATSIDALVAGAAMVFLKPNIIEGASQAVNMGVSIFLIALITLLFSLAGLFLGRRSRGRLGGHAELIGGVILILIGVKVLIEHLSGA